MVRIAGMHPTPGAQRADLLWFPFKPVFPSHPEHLLSTLSVCEVEKHVGS